MGGEDGRPADRTRRRWFRWAALVLGLFVPLLAAELGVRILSPSGVVTPESQRTSLLRYEPAAFSSAVFADEAHVGKGWGRPDYWRINELGYAGDGFPEEKPEGVVRIVIYGGSAVFDFRSPTGRDWPSRTQEFLRERGHAQVQVINAGVPGTITADSVGRLLTEGHRLEPDVVVLYHGWNEMKFLSSERPLLRERKPFELDPRLYYSGALDRTLCEWSQLYVRLRDRYYTAQLGEHLEGRRPPAKPEFREGASDAGIRQFELTVRAWCRLAHAVGAVPVVASQARLARVDNPASDRERIGYRTARLDHGALCRVWARLDRILEDVAGEENGVFLDIGGPLTGRSDLFVDHVHTTPEGSRVLASRAAELLDEVLRR